jgi:hypothetical protein
MNDHQHPTSRVLLVELVVPDPAVPGPAPLIDLNDARRQGAHRSEVRRAAAAVGLNGNARHYVPRS